MHKCIMVKVGGRKNTRKAWENFEKQRENKNFRESGGKML